MTGTNGTGEQTVESVREATLALAESIAKKHEKAPEAAPVPPKAAQPADEDEDDDPEPVEAEAADDDPEYVEAPARLGIRALTNEQLVALRRGQVSDRIIDSLPDDELKELADIEAAKEKRGKERFEARKGSRATEEGRQRETAEEDVPDDASPTPSEPAKKSPSRGLPQPLREALSLDDSEAKTLEKWIREENLRVAAVVQAQADARLGTLETALQRMQMHTQRANELAVSQAANSVWAELRPEWPELAMADVRSKVWKRFEAIAAGYGGPGVDINTAMHRGLHDAAFMELGPPATEKPKRAEKPAPSRQKPAEAEASQRKRKLTPQELTKRNAEEVARKHGLKNANRRRW